MTGLCKYDGSCMVCLENSCAITMFRLCMNTRCTCRIHFTCYYQWCKHESYNGYCICGDSIDSRRFGLPNCFIARIYPNSALVSSLTLPTTERNIEVLSSTDQNSCQNPLRKMISFNQDKFVYLLRYYIIWFWVNSYFGKVLLYLFNMDIVWEFWTYRGLGLQLYSFIMGSIVMWVFFVLVMVYSIANRNSQN